MTPGESRDLYSAENYGDRNASFTHVRAVPAVFFGVLT